MKSSDCTEALKRISAQINMEKINTIIEEMPVLLPIQKEFYMVMITERKTKIIDYSMGQIIKSKKQECNSI